MTADAFRLDLVELLQPDKLLLVWGDGHESLYPFRLLRAKCTCASCVDEWTGEKLLADDRIADGIRVDRWDATGRYGLHLYFSDGHSTGIYTLKNLRGMCPCPECHESRE